MTADRNIKVPNLILSTFLLSQTDIVLKRFIAKIGTIFELCDIKMEVALHLSLQLANFKSQRSDFGAVCKANNGTWRFHYRWLNFLMK